MNERPDPAPRASGAAVELQGVVRVFEGNVRALDGVDLSVEAGEFVAITGPSGCGKSTLLNLVAALDFPTAGHVAIDGRDIRRIGSLGRYRRDEVGLVFQFHNLLPHHSVLANVEVAMLGTDRSRHEQRSRARELLAEVDLQGRERRSPTQLSGGERQRVAIARALANDPRLLLADEPTGSLDSESSRRVLDLFDHVRSRGATIILVTHDPAVARIADRVVTMADGRILATAEPDAGALWMRPAV